MTHGATFCSDLFRNLVRRLGRPKSGLPQFTHDGAAWEFFGIVSSLYGTLSQLFDRLCYSTIPRLLGFCLFDRIYEEPLFTVGKGHKGSIGSLVFRERCSRCGRGRYRARLIVHFDFDIHLLARKNSGIFPARWMKDRNFMSGPPACATPLRPATQSTPNSG